MALNSDFKVKDSLYVGSSACFVTCTDTPRILSAGTDLWDIFLQEDEISTSCTLSNGDGVATLSYDGQADVTISLDTAVVDGIAEGSAQGQVAVTNIGNTTTQVDVNGLQTNDSPEFNGMCLTGPFTTSSTIDGRDVAVDGVTLDTLQSLSADQSLTFSSPSQGTLRITDADSDTTDIDLGVQSADSVQFVGGCYTGSITVDGTVDGRDVANDGTTLDTLQSLSGANIDTGSSPSQGTVRLTSADGSNTDIDTGLQTGDSPSFAGVTADNIQIGVTGANEIDTSSGNLTIDSAGGTVIIDDNTTLCGAVTLGTGTIAGVSNTVLVSDGGQVKTDVIDSRVWGTTLIDGSGTANNITMWSDADTVTNSIITQNSGGTAVNIAGGLTVMDNLSVMGTFTCLDTSVSTTSALSVINTGTGPAFYAEQTGASQPIAKFVDTEGGQMVIGDTGNVGIGGSTDAPAEKLVVTGNACVSNCLTVGGSLTIAGDSTLGDAAGDDTTLNSAVINAPNIASGTQNGDQVLTRNSDDEIVLDGVDPKIFTSTTLVDGSGTCGKVAKYTVTGDTIGDSNITDTGSLITLDSDVTIGSGDSIKLPAAGGSIFALEQTFTGTVGTTATTLTTFAKTNLKSAKFEVTLIKGVNITAFEVLAVYNGTAASGTTYAIVDAQAASQLADVTISTTGTTIDLDITAAAATTTAVVHGTATY